MDSCFLTNSEALKQLALPNVIKPVNLKTSNVFKAFKYTFLARRLQGLYFWASCQRPVVGDIINHSEHCHPLVGAIGLKSKLEVE